MSIINKIGSGIKFCVSHTIGLGTVLIGGTVIAVPTLVVATVASATAAAGTKLINTASKEENQQSVYDNSTSVGLSTLQGGVNTFNYCRPKLFSGGVLAADAASSLTYNIAVGACNATHYVASAAYNKYKQKV